MPAKLALSSAAFMFLAACSNNKLPLIGSSQKPGSITLSKEQIGATHDGVRRMIPNPQSSKFLGDTARKAKEGPGIEVCGNVDYLDTDGKTRVEQPYYVELRETNGQPNAERGQVGGDPSKLAKVRFLCREHN